MVGVGEVGVGVVVSRWREGEGVSVRVLLGVVDGDG